MFFRTGILQWAEAQISVYLLRWFFPQLTVTIGIAGSLATIGICRRRRQRFLCTRGDRTSVWVRSMEARNPVFAVRRVLCPARRPTPPAGRPVAPPPVRVEPAFADGNGRVTRELVPWHLDGPQHLGNHRPKAGSGDRSQVAHQTGDVVQPRDYPIPAYPRRSVNRRRRGHRTPRVHRTGTRRNLG